MAGTSIPSDYYLSSYKKPMRETGNSVLGKDDFLKILITQLQYQDPTNPVDDKEFIAQMAQFSSLEQMQNMTKAMEDLLASQHETQLMAYTSFVGQTVKWHQLTDEADENGLPVIKKGEGLITELKFDNGAPIFVLEDGKEISSGDISSVVRNKTSENVVENPLVEASKIIGKKVKYKDDNGQSVEAIIEAVSTNNKIIEYILENNVRLTKDQFEILN